MSRNVPYVRGELVTVLDEQTKGRQGELGATSPEATVRVRYGDGEIGMVRPSDIAYEEVRS
jgi:hypothetical protein